ncbi:MAG: SpoIIE family protein phosphatase [Candidatus Schekmanbacteria bacterium]|nr:SpoIIE family protein phosphatase [Candidatus Schekmanbacteria bacterium]
MSIRTKITIGILGVALIVVPTSNYVAAMKQQETLSLNLEAKGKLLTRLVSMTSANAIAGGDYVFLARTVKQAATDPDVVFGMILNEAGEIIAYADRKGKTETDLHVDDTAADSAIRVDIPFVVETLRKGARDEVRQNIKVVSFDGEPILDLATAVLVPGGETDKRWGLVRFGLSRARVIEAIATARRTNFYQSVALVVLGLLVAIALSRRITNPIKELVRDATEIAEGNLTCPVAIPTSRDEVFKLASKFEEMRASLIKQMEQLSLKERLEAELQTAKTIQMTLMPQQNPVLPGYDIAGACVTASEVGGDYYDFATCGTDDNEQLAVAIGDVNGHGVAAGLIMAVAKACLRTQVRVGSALPDNVLGTLNKVISESAQRRLLMTFFYTLLDVPTGTVHYSNAGHNFPYVYRSSRKSLEELDVGGKPLGFDGSVSYANMSTGLEPGDALILYTDGLVEAEAVDGTLYDYDRFEGMLRDHIDKPASELVEVLMNDAKQFVGSGPLDDDITLVVIKRQR